jgi:hypothetical protein
MLDIRNIGCPPFSSNPAPGYGSAHHNIKESRIHEALIYCSGRLDIPASNIIGWNTLRVNTKILLVLCWLSFCIQH